MRTQTIGAVMLIMALCLMSAAFAENETGNETGNYTETNETGNDTNQTEINQTGNQTGLNQTNSTGNTTTNDTSISNETDNQTGNTTLTGNETNITNTTIANDTNSESTGEELDSDDERHICLMNEPYGIEIRYLQLERAVMRNALIGAKAIEIINESNNDANLTGSQAILDELEDLLQEIKDTDLDGNKTELAKDFVDYKKDASLLSESFRESIQPFLNRTIRQEINNATREIDRTAFKDIDDEIRLAKCSLNAERVEKILLDLNTTDAAFVEKVSECNATEEEIRDKVYDAFRNLIPEQKREYLKRAREGLIRSSIGKKALMEEMRSGYFERRMERQDRIVEKLQERLGKLKIQMDKFMKKFEERMDGTRMKIEQIREKQQGKPEKFEGKWPGRHDVGGER